MVMMASQVGDGFVQSSPLLALWLPHQPFPLQLHGAAIWRYRDLVAGPYAPSSCGISPNIEGPLASWR